MIYYKKLEGANEIDKQQSKEGSKSLFTKQTYKYQNRVTSSKLLMINRDLRQKLDTSTDKKFTACQTQTMTGKVLKLQTSEGT